MNFNAFSFLNFNILLKHTPVVSCCRRPSSGPDHPVHASARKRHRRHIVHGGEYIARFARLPTADVRFASGVAVHLSTYTKVL